MKAYDSALRVSFFACFLIGWRMIVIMRLLDLVCLAHSIGWVQMDERVGCELMLGFFVAVGLGEWMGLIGLGFGGVGFEHVLIGGSGSSV